MRQVTKVLLSCELPGTAGPSTSSPTLGCVSLPGAAVGARGAVVTQPWVAVEEHPCTQPLSSLLPAPSGINPSGSAVRLGKSYPLQVPQCLLCLASLTFLLRVCTKKNQGPQSHFWVVKELLLPSLPCLTLSYREQIELQIPGEQDGLMIPP